MTDVERRILENQEIILLGLNKLLTPHCNGSANDANGETRANVLIIDAYHSTRIFLGKEEPYI